MRGSLSWLLTCLIFRVIFGFVVATSSGAAPKLIKQFSGFFKSFAWSSDDKTLDFAGLSGDSLRELSLKDGASGLLAPISDIGQLCISARGNRLAYATEYGGNGNIWRADLLHHEANPVKLISTTHSMELQGRLYLRGEFLALVHPLGFLTLRAVRICFTSTAPSY